MDRDRIARGLNVLFLILKDLRAYLIAGFLLLMIVVTKVLSKIPDNVLLVLAALFLVGSLVFFRYRDARRLKQRSLDAMSPELRAEVEEERRVNRLKKKHFLEALDKAGGGGTSSA